MKAAVVYWSATGNTEAMANEIVNGVKEAGGEAELLRAGEFDAEAAFQYDAFAFGCPAMGAEELEDTEFLPMWEQVSGRLEQKPVVLFGSYGWGDGEWMNTWKESAPCTVLASCICQDAPDSEKQAECRALGAKLVQ